MSYTVQKMTEIDFDAFQRLLDSSLPALKLNYNFPEEDDTDRKKSVHIFTNLHSIVYEGGRGFAWEEKEGDHILSYNIGGFFETDENGFHTGILNFSMFGPNTQGSKSYLYDSDYIQTYITFWKSMFVKRLLLRFLNTNSNNTAYQTMVDRQATIISTAGGSFTNGVVMEWDFS